MKTRHNEGVIISPQVLERLKWKTLIASAGASTRLAGAKMTDKEIERFILESRPRGSVPLNCLNEENSGEVRGM